MSNISETPGTTSVVPPETLSTQEIPDIPSSSGSNGLEGRISRLETKVDKLSDDIHQAIVDFHKTNLSVLQAISDFKTEFVEFRATTVTQLKALNERIVDLGKRLDDGIKHSRDISNILAGLIIAGIVVIFLKLFL
jgi:hypothetical protein